MVSRSVLWGLRIGIGCVVLWVCVVFFELPIPDQLPQLALSRQCDPFRHRGILQVSSDPVLNRWLPFDAECHASDVLFPTLKASWDEVAPSTKPLFPDAVESEDLGAVDTSRLRGKTVLMIGDSLTRFNTIQFCGLFGEEPVPIDKSHPYSPPEPTDIHPVLNTTGSFPRIKPPAVDHQIRDDGHGSHYCYIPSLDLMLVQVFTFGMDEDFYWQWREKGVPYIFDYRVSYLAKGTMERTGRGEPDLVLVGSALWDSARWMREDLAADVDTDSGLSRERIDWYRQRVAEVLQATRTTFPASTLKWMSNHYPIVAKSNGWFTEGAEGNKTRPLNKVIRLSQMNQIARSVIDQGIGRADLFDWGQLMLGQEAHQIDDLHTSVIPGGILFAEMMLYYLYQGPAGWFN